MNRRRWRLKSGRKTERAEGRATKRTNGDREREREKTAWIRGGSRVAVMAMVWDRGWLAEGVLAGAETVHYDRDRAWHG